MSTNYIHEISPNNGEDVFKIKDAEAAPISLLDDTVGWDCRNILPLTLDILKANNTNGTWSGNAYSINSTVYTITTNSDGYVTEIDVDGTPSASHNFSLLQKTQLSFLLADIGESFTLSGCPSGGSDSTYRMSAISLDGVDGSQNAEYGSGKTFTIGDFSSFIGDAYIVIRAYSGATISHKKFHPMLVKSEYADLPFAPYHKPVSEWGYTRDEANVLGAKNSFYVGENVSSLTPTITDNGKTINVAVATAGTYKMAKFKVPVVKNTDYIFVSNADYTSGAGYVAIASSSDVEIVNSGSSFRTDTDISLSFNSGNNEFIYIKLCCTTGTSEIGDITYNNSMLLLATDTDDTYQPFAMPNQQLTEKVSIMLPIDFSGATELAANTNLNNLGVGIAKCSNSNSSTIVNKPNGVGGAFDIITMNTWDANYKRQIYILRDSYGILTRICNSGSWGDWYSMSMTVIS